MTLPIVRSMQRSDLDDIVPLERRAFSDPWTRTMYVRDLTGNDLATYLVVTPGVAGSPSLPHILAWGGFWLLVDEAHIATIASHPDWRGCGLGLWMMLGLLAAASDREARLATLEVRQGNIPAQRLYRKLGFEVVGRRPRYYADGEDGLIMTTPPLADPQQKERLGLVHAEALHRMARCFGEV